MLHSFSFEVIYDDYDYNPQHSSLRIQNHHLLPFENDLHSHLSSIFHEVMITSGWHLTETWLLQLVKVLQGQHWDVLNTYGDSPTIPTIYPFSIAILEFNKTMLITSLKEREYCLEGSLRAVCTKLNIKDIEMAMTPIYDAIIIISRFWKKLNCHS